MYDQLEASPYILRQEAIIQAKMACIKDPKKSMEDCLKCDLSCVNKASK